MKRNLEKSEIWTDFYVLQRKTAIVNIKYYFNNNIIKCSNLSLTKKAVIFLKGQKHKAQIMLYKTKFARQTYINKIHKINYQYFYMKRG